MGETWLGPSTGWFFRKRGKRALLRENGGSASRRREEVTHKGWDGAEGLGEFCSLRCMTCNYHRFMIKFALVVEVSAQFWPAGRCGEKWLLLDVTLVTSI